MKGIRDTHDLQEISYSMIRQSEDSPARSVIATILPMWIVPPSPSSETLSAWTLFVGILAQSAGSCGRSTNRLPVGRIARMVVREDFGKVVSSARHCWRSRPFSPA